MTPAEFEARIISWARSRTDVEALVQIGSRVQPGSEVDAWSDWDYHLIVHQPARYRSPGWLDEIGPCWNAHVEVTERRVAKLSAIFEGGIEVDIVPLAAWQMKLVYWAMRHPEFAGFYPRPLATGVANTRLVVGPGYRLLVGSPAWERRLAALANSPSLPVMGEREFAEIVDGFWRHAVWVHKKVMRGEVRAAGRWFHREVAERRWLLLEEEARLAGRPARPEGRKAEQWLDETRLRQTVISANADQSELAQALLAEMDLFEDVRARVAAKQGFPQADRSPLISWLRAELGPLAGRQ
jgi:hypothetical protein